MRVGLVGAELGLFLIALELRIGLDIGFLHHTEGPDNLEWHLAHLQACWHRVETPLEDEIHQRCMDQIVLMVAEGYLVAAKFLRKVE